MSNSGARGGGVSLREFVDEFYDPTACDGFEPCGDVVSGRFQYASAKLCFESEEFESVESLEEELGSICTSGITTYLQYEIDMVIDVVDAQCTGQAEADLSMVFEMSAACIAESGGGSLQEACPQLEEGLQGSGADSGECDVIGNVCSCILHMGEFVRGQCEDFVLDSACLDGDTLRFSSSGEDSEPVIWTFIRVEGEAKAASTQQALFAPHAVLDVRTIESGQREPLLVRATWM